jgi:hypothetical protein
MRAIIDIKAMDSANPITFAGAGVNSSSLRAAFTAAMNVPAKRVRPLGATWPFVRLTIRKELAEFDLPRVHKSARRSDVEVNLSKLGYVFFNSNNPANDFGFCSLRIDALLRELRSRGYRLNDSCTRNLRVAKTSIFSIVALQAAIVIVVVVAGVLKARA